MKVREVRAYKHYFTDFLRAQTQKVQLKILKVIEAIEILERVPSHFLKHLEGTDGLYEARVKLGSDIWRVFCFFEEDKLIILLNGFQKKTQKTPQGEIMRAQNLMKQYYAEKAKKP